MTLDCCLALNNSGDLRTLNPLSKGLFPDGWFWVAISSDDLGQRQLCYHHSSLMVMVVLKSWTSSFKTYYSFRSELLNENKRNIAEID